MKKLILACAMVSILIRFDSVLADEIYSNFGPGDSYNPGLPAPGIGGPTFLETAAAFSISGSDFIFETAEVPISFLVDLGGANEITLTLFDMVNDLPANPLDSATLTDFLQFPSSEIRTFDFVGNARLEAGETYFLAARGTMSPMAWLVNDQGIGGIRATRQGTGDWTVDTVPAAAAFRVGGTPIPEPGNVFVLISGLCCLFFRRQTR